MADVLIFGAHPDDIEFAMGGTALLLRKAGYDVVFVVLTHGGKGSHGTPGDREKEVHAAARFAGVGLELLDFEDGQVFDSIENRLLIARIIRKHTPRIVFAPYFDNNSGHQSGASHPDHMATGTLVRFACRYAKFKGTDLGLPPHLVRRVYYYMVPRNRTPSFIVDCSSVRKDWERLVQKHKSQLFGNVVEFLSVWRVSTGSLLRIGFAEGFLVEEPLSLGVRDLLQA